MSPNEVKMKNKPWLSADNLKLIKVRNKVFARKKRQPDNENCKRLYSDLIIIPLAYIINMSFLTGEYPDSLQLVKVIPIHKGGSTQDTNNYRSIFLLSILIKLLKN